MTAAETLGAVLEREHHEIDAAIETFLTSRSEGKHEESR
jgi:hypothetical protein